METLAKKTLFWDVKRPDPKKDAHFIIERILNFGDIEDFKWALNYYGQRTIKQELLKGLNLARKPIYFWCQYFNLDKSKCLAKQLKAEHSAFWNR